MDELKARPDKTKADKMIPKVAHSAVASNPSQNSEWLSPWGQALALLKGIAEFLRDALATELANEGGIDEQKCLLSNAPPTYPRCSGLARPNVLLVGHLALDRTAQWLPRCPLGGRR